MQTLLLYLAVGVIGICFVRMMRIKPVFKDSLLPIHTETEKERAEELKKVRLRQQLTHWSIGNKIARQEKSKIARQEKSWGNKVVEAQAD